MSGAGKGLAALLATALVVSTAPTAVHAIEIFGFTFFEGEPEPPPEGAVTYTVEFAVAGDSGLERQLENASALADEADEPSPSGAALLALARSDYQRLLATLYAEGRYGGTISIAVEGQEASELPPDTELGDTAGVVITVDPGPQYAFGDVTVTGRPGPIVGDDDVPQTPEELGLVPGAPARSGTVIASEAALVGRWRERAHPKAAIAQRTAVARHGEDELDVAIAVDPGRSAVFGPTSVTGTDRMDPAFVAYYAGIEPGEPFDPDDLERAREQLRRLEVFQATRIVEADEIGIDGALPIELLVAERKRRVFGIGAAFSTVDGAGFETFWRHRNLFGRAEKLRLEGRVGGINGENPDEYNYRVAATFQKPGVIDPYTDFIATIYAEQEAPDTYRARFVGTRFGLNRRITERLTWDTFAMIEASTIDMTEVGDGDFLFLSLPNTLAYDGTDSEFDPVRGYRVAGKLEPFYETENANFGLVSELGASVYRAVGPRVVLAARANAGSITGAPLDEVPANRQFYTGGGGRDGIRGYPFRGVGPVIIDEDGDEDVIGGRSYFTASVEARVGVTETIGVVPFVDFGNAFESEYPDFSEPLRFGVGAGLRYRTGLGPVRLDVAVPLDPLEGDPSFAFYIGLGQAF